MLSLIVACHPMTQSTAATKAPAKSTATAADKAIRLRPPDFTIASKTSTQAAIQGAYYWQLADGLAVNVNSGGFATSGVAPMDVAQNDQLTITVTNGSYPDKIDLKIYKQQGNLVDVPVATGGVKAFEVKTASIAEQTFSDTPYQLNVNLAPGDYFILVAATWSNPYKRAPATLTSSATPPPVKPLTDQVAFWIQVQ
jgi:hypothetical protein